MIVRRMAGSALTLPLQDTPVREEGIGGIDMDRYLKLHTDKKILLCCLPVQHFLEDILRYLIANRLKNALDDVYDQLTPEEMRRNQRGDDRLYVSVKHPSYTSMVDLYRMGMDRHNEVGLALPC